LKREVGHLSEIATNRERFGITEGLPGYGDGIA
jgi:hypothetical protein